MNLEFEAKSVSYEEALGGDIVQVGFDENPDDAPINPSSRSLCFSVNYEFPPCKLNFEWCNGTDYDGGAKALKYSLGKSKFSVWLDNGHFIKVGFSTDPQTYSKISCLLHREIGESENA